MWGENQHATTRCQCHVNVCLLAGLFAVVRCMRDWKERLCQALCCSTTLIVTGQFVIHRTNSEFGAVRPGSRPDLPQPRPPPVC